MSIPVRFLPVLTCVLMLLDGRAASAATPTPTLTPVPVSTATPVPPQPALFDVIPWVNGQDDTARSVTANIGGTLCATGQPSFPTGSRPRAVFQLSVPAEEALPGCGYEGAVVTFFVDGHQAPQTAIWHPGHMSQTLNVIIGPPFARFIMASGGEVPQPFGPDRRLVPYIGDKPCGYGGIVYSNEQGAGCGVEGSQVTFKLLDAQGNVIAVANETATWHAWDGVSDPYAQPLNLTFGPAGVITMPSTGDGPAQATAPWELLALALASLGLAGGIAALAFRRRAMAR